MLSPSPTRSSLCPAAVTVTLSLLVLSSAAAGQGARFTDIASEPGSGIDFERARSATFAAIEAFQLQSLSEPLPMSVLPTMPTRVYGIPGVAILDYDRDGDLDIYATNGPGAANSLFSNQLVESGALTFVDLAGAAGVEATAQDSTGVCYGDVDNDFDQDLLVLGRSEPNRFFESNGDGTFQEVPGSGLEGGNLSSVSCSMGDVNGDGLLDVTVANTFDYSSLFAIVVEPFLLNHPNQLFLNQGGNLFADVSTSSGIRDLTGLPPGVATITWASAMVDVDLDGDLDVLYADDQGAIPTAKYGGIDRGYLHILLNDGSGNFSDTPVILSPESSGSWMGLAFGDLNCDGAMDLFGSNFGDYDIPSLGSPLYQLGDQASRWFYGNGDGSFYEPGIGSTVATTFGWGTAIFDYDNDGDQDILYHGSLEMNFVALADNPGTLLANQSCGTDYLYDADAFATDYIAHNVNGAAVGDLDRDGFVDVVTASNFDIQGFLPRFPSPASYGSVFDATAFVVPLFEPTPQGMVWGGVNLAPGTLTVERNSGGDGGDDDGGDNGDDDDDDGDDGDGDDGGDDDDGDDGGDDDEGDDDDDEGDDDEGDDDEGDDDDGDEGDDRNSSVTVATLGSVGLVDGAVVNRDGIGAVLFFRPHEGEAVMTPIQGGSSLGSQHALEGYFGLGRRSFGTLEVLWPGGVRNRLHLVRRGERILLPEIPCSFDGDWPGFREYASCVDDALDQLRDAGVISRRESQRLKASAVQAFFEEN